MLCKYNKKEGHSQISRSFKFLSFRCLAHFDAVWHANAPKYGKNFNISGVKIFRGSDRIWQSQKFLLSLYQAYTLNQPQKWGRTQENWCKEGQSDSDSQTSFFLIEWDVHVYIARCLFGARKGFEGPNPTKRPCMVGNTPKSHSPFLKLRCHEPSSHWRWNKQEVFMRRCPWWKIIS